MQGKGTMFFADGDSLHSKWVGSFEGEWKDNQKHGKGVFSYANGDKYDGMLRRERERERQERVREKKNKKEIKKKV
jgi:hypothetical protein